MSANNELRIEKMGKRWMVSDIDIEGRGGYFIDDAGFPTLEEAVHAANEYSKKYPVEYGLHIIEENQ